FDLNIFQGLLAMSAAALFLVGCGASTDSQAQNESAKAAAGETASSSTQCEPLETRPRETKYEPAFEGQTRAPCVNSNVDLSATVITADLAHPWGVGPRPDGKLLVTEKTGQMRIVSQDGKVGPAITGVPKVDSRGQGGLLDVA